jgi:hypothetical protein
MESVRNEVLAALETLPGPPVEMSEELLSPLIDAWDLMAIRTIYPTYDELSRLICKNCGRAFKNWTLEGLVKDRAELFETKEAALAWFNCTNCKRVNLFSAYELRNQSYRPTRALPQLRRTRRSRDDLGSSTGHLKCGGCHIPHDAFTLKGLCDLLESSGQPQAILSCVQCGGWRRGSGWN